MEWAWGMGLLPAPLFLLAGGRLRPLLFMFDAVAIIVVVVDCCCGRIVVSVVFRYYFNFGIDFRCFMSTETHGQNKKNARMAGGAFLYSSGCIFIRAKGYYMPS